VRCVQQAKKEIVLRLGGESGYRAAVQFEQLYRRLLHASNAANHSHTQTRSHTHTPLLRHRAAMLQFLMNMQGMEEEEDDSVALVPSVPSNYSSHSLSSHSSRPASSPSSALTLRSSTQPASAIAPHSQSSALTHADSGRSSQAVIPTTAPSSSPSSSLSPSQQLLLAHTNTSVSEPALLRDMLYTLLGSDGNYVQYNAAADAFLLSPSVTVSKPMRLLVERICELGWLYRKVSGYVTQVMDNETSSNAGVGAHNAGTVLSLKSGSVTHSRTSSALMLTQGGSLTSTRSDAMPHAYSGKIEQSFAATLRDELSEYIRLVTLLEGQVESDLRASDHSDARHSHQPASTHRSTDSSASNSSSQFTLRRLLVWVQDPLQRLSLLAILADAASGVKGGALVSVVGAHMKHGDPLVVALMKRIMRKTCAPLFDMLSRWLSSGTLLDPFSEFFIFSDSTSADAQDPSSPRYWSRHFRLRRCMIPDFFPRPLVKKILNIGKAVNFIRNQCKETKYMAEIEVDFKQMFANGTDMSRFSQSIEACSDRVHAHLLHLLTETYSFYAHAHALKKYLLLTQGDFAQQLLELMHTELDKPARDLSTSTILSLLESAKRSSSARGEIDEVLSRIGARKLATLTGAVDGDMKGADRGWDVFVLVYHFDHSPLQVVFSSSAQAAYLKLFTFLFKLKRVQMRLNRSWFVQTKVGHSAAMKELMQALTVQPAEAMYGAPSSTSATRPLSALEPSLRLVAALRNEMLHFANNLHSYLMFEVLECAWTEFARKIGLDERMPDVNINNANTATGVATGTHAVPSGRASTRVSQPSSPRASVIPSSTTASSTVGSGVMRGTFTFNPSSTAASSPTSPSKPQQSQPATGKDSTPQHSLDLDGLIRAHKVFLQQIVDKALLGGDSQPLFPQLQTLFQLILSFTSFNDRLYECLERELERRASIRANIARTERTGGWGVGARGLGAQSLQPFLASLTTLMREFRSIASQWRSHLSTFLRALKHANRSAHKRIGSMTMMDEIGDNFEENVEGKNTQDDEDEDVDDEEEEDGALDESVAPLPSAPTPAHALSSPLPSQRSRSQLLRAQRAASNLHDLDFLRFRLDFNEFYLLNKKEHARQVAEHMADKGNATKTASSMNVRMAPPMPNRAPPQPHSNGR